MTVDPAESMHLLRAAGRQGTLVTEPNTQDIKKLKHLRLCFQCLPLYPSHTVNSLYSCLHAMRQLPGAHLLSALLLEPDGNLR